MIFRESITMRPLKWAVIATHTMRDKLDSIDVDFTSAEKAIADKIEALSTKMDQIMERLEAYETKANEQQEEASSVQKKPRAKRAAKK
jgi:DNA-binding protein H-NS